LCGFSRPWTGTYRMFRIRVIVSCARVRGREGRVQPRCTLQAAYDNCCNCYNPTSHSVLTAARNIPFSRRGTTSTIRPDAASHSAVQCAGPENSGGKGTASPGRLGLVDADADAETHTSAAQYRARCADELEFSTRDSRVSQTFAFSAQVGYIRSSSGRGSSGDYTPAEEIPPIAYRIPPHLLLRKDCSDQAQAHSNHLSDDIRRL
jgi:hypothetical protein